MIREPVQGITEVRTRGALSCGQRAWMLDACGLAAGRLHAAGAGRCEEPSYVECLPEPCRVSSGAILACALRHTHTTSNQTALATVPVGEPNTNKLLQLAHRR